MRPELIKLGSLVSIIGAIIALVVLAINANEEGNIAIMLCMLVIAVLFFAIAGNFHENGISKSQPLALILVAIVLAVIIATYVIENGFGVGHMLALIICALIPGAIAVAETKWYDFERI